MATQFPEPIGVSIVDQEDRIAPMPAVPNYAVIRRSIVVIWKEPSQKLCLRTVCIEPATEYIYATDVRKGVIHIFSQTGDYLNHFRDPHLLVPWGILIHQDNIYVTDVKQHAIFLFRLPDLKMIKKVGKRGSGREEFRYPRQLAISPERHLYVADELNNRLQILTTHLEFTDKLQHQSMFNPVDVKFSSNEMFVLSCEGSKCIHVFTFSGKKIRSLVTIGDGMQVNSAWFFCLDGHNNILINECFGDNIKVFSQEGDLLHVIIRKADINYGITAHKNNIIHIIDYKVEKFSFCN